MRRRNFLALSAAAAVAPSLLVDEPSIWERLTPDKRWRRVRWEEIKAEDVIRSCEQPEKVWRVVRGATVQDPDTIFVY